MSENILPEDDSKATPSNAPQPPLTEGDLQQPAASTSNNTASDKPPVKKVKVQKIKLTVAEPQKVKRVTKETSFSKKDAVTTPAKKIASKKVEAKKSSSTDALLPAQQSKTKPPKVLRKRTSQGLQRITFQLKFYTKMGQSLGVTGNHPLLGNNDYTNAFALEYLDNNYWYGSLDIPGDKPITEPVVYKYFLKGEDGVITPEWGDDKVIDPAAYTTPEISLFDTWNYAGFIENTFYTEPFRQVLLKQHYTPVATNEPGTYTHLFKVKAPLLLKGQAACIIGSVPELSNWNTKQPLLLSKKEDEDWYTIKLNLADSAVPVYYKYGVYDVDENKFIRYEEDKNRYIYNDRCKGKLTIVNDGFLVVPNNTFKGAGVAIPVFSLRSQNSFGVGEFNDVKLMVDWAKQVGLKLVQILPVNDTTATYTKADSYPYAAISAFALHPLYLHLPAMVNKKTQELLNDFNEVQSLLNSKTEVDYVDVMEAKWSFIETVFPLLKKEVFRSASFKSFYNENEHWLVPYASFCYFRNKFKTPDFTQWQTNQTYNANEIAALASTPLKAPDEISINYFVQYHLHLQLKEATDYAHANGIILKGDIPIGIYRYSCDAWQQPHLYNMDMQAGAPPDDFAVKGQNWGFPTYNWQQMQQDGFEWWKKRFKQMSYYFDAFRIDHILGFFRIWSIPLNAVEGIMGRFVPALPVYINEFSERGIAFNHQRFCKPFINNDVLLHVFGSNSNLVKEEFLNPDEAGAYCLKDEFNTQRKVEDYFSSKDKNALNKKLKEGLFDLISNIILFEEGSDGTKFHFRISMESTTSFRHLNGDTQHKLKELYINYFYRRQDGFWYTEAMKKLPELKRSTNMLICGEDLGMVPDCVPGVMKALAILSLEIQRMPKDPTRSFFHPNDAPYLSVVTPSTHDMSTIRGWWEEDRAVTQQFYNYELGQWGTAPYYCEPWINEIILKQHLYSPAMWSIFQLQDLLGISEELRRENPHDERINIPADPKHYWRYRMHINLEDLINHTSFNTQLKALLQQAKR